MDLVPVSSSNIEAIGYNADCRLLRVAYRDGAVYDFPDIGPATHAALMSADSKGHWMANLSRRGVRVTGEEVVGSVAAPISSAVAAGPAPTVEPAVLNSIDPDAGVCCRRALARVLPETTYFECPSCGEQFRVVMIGPLRHWQIKPYIALALGRPLS